MGLDLPGGWSHVGAGRAVVAELRAEIAPGHVLHRRVDQVEARFDAADDVIVRLTDGGYAPVHPTWSGRAETPPYPRAVLLGPADVAPAAIARWTTDALGE